MLTVDRVLATPGLALEPVVVIDADRPVGWVATSELTDPTPYLQGHEVLLTTGLGTAAWSEEWDGYVARLVAADLAALGLGVGLTHEVPPPALARACERHGLNLFAVPRPTAFVAVSRAVAALLDEEAEHEARQALEAQRALVRCALGGDEAALLRQLGTLVHGAAAVVDADGADAALGEGAGGAGGAGHTVVHPLGIAPRPTSWLAVTTDAPLPDPHRTAVSTTVALLTLADERRRERRSHDRGVRAQGVTLVLEGAAGTAALLLDAVGARLPHGPVRVLRVRAEETAEVVDVLDELGVLAAARDSEVVAICPDRRSTAVASRLTAGGAAVGIGAATGIDEAARSHDTAIHALARTGPQAPARSWDELHESGVVALLGAAAAPYAQEWLAPLADDPTLLETLRAYVAHHGSVGAVAAALGVHRNTVRNRVATLEDRLGRSLDDAATRAEAWLALSVAGRGGGW